MSRQISPLWIALMLAVAVIGALLLYFGVLRTPAPPPAPAPTPAEMPKPAVEPVPPPPVDLPELEASDELVRDLVGTLSKHPTLAEWLVPDSLLRRFVATVDNVSRGESPRPHLRKLDPGPAPDPALRDGQMVLSPESFQRYDAFAAVFTSLDTAGGVRLYQNLKPLIEEAYQNLGYPEGAFDPVLARAIDHMLATPIPSGEIELEREVTTYVLADANLEGLSEAQKHFLRMGPSNMRQIHAKLRLMRTALGLESASDTLP